MKNPKNILLRVFPTHPNLNDPLENFKISVVGKKKDIYFLMVEEDDLVAEGFNIFAVDYREKAVHHMGFSYDHNFEDEEDEAPSLKEIWREFKDMDGLKLHEDYQARPFPADYTAVAQKKERFC